MMVVKTLSVDDALQISEQLSPADQLRLIGLLSERLRRSIEAGQEAVDMLTLAGVGADLWRDIDVDAYLAAERASWDR
jgi:hypothetical protein